MRRIIQLLLLCVFLTGTVAAGDFQQEAEEMFGVEQVEVALPEAADVYMDGIDTSTSLTDGIWHILKGTLGSGEGAIREAAALCVQILIIVLLAAMLRSFGDGGTTMAMELAAVLTIGMCCMGRVSGLFSQAAETVDDMSAFSTLLFSTLAAATAATGATGTSTALYGITTALCGLLSRGMQMVFLPAISCYMALTLADYAVGDGSLRLMGDLIKQLVTTALKLLVVGFTAYVSLTGVVSGSADAAAVKAAKLTISTAVPVVGSMLADASETLLVSAGLIRSSVGIFGLLGVLAVSIGPFLKTGIGYLGLKCTAAVAAATGEKQLSGLISAMAGAVGLITALTGVCTLLLMISCVCFLRCAVG